MDYADGVLLRWVAHFLLQLKSMIEKSTPELFKFNSVWKPSEHDDVLRYWLMKERECLTRIWLNMNSSLVLGKSLQICSSLLLIPFRMVTRLVYTIFNMYLFHYLGRRGVFDGVMEILHQHWKHKEVAFVWRLRWKLWFKGGISRLSSN